VEGPPNHGRDGFVDLGGTVHFVEWDGARERVFVLVHGLGGSHVNWLSVAPRLARLGRVLVPDLAGFGRTPLAGRSAAILANRQLLGTFIDATSAAPVVLVGNSMGGAISALHAAAAPKQVMGLVLVDPALPRTAGQLPDAQVAALFATYMVPGIGERFVRERARRLGAERLVGETLAMCCVDASRVDPEIVRMSIEMAREREQMPWAPRAFIQATRSMLRLLARRDRFLATLGKIACPTLMMMGRFDRLVALAAAENAARLHPEWDFVVFDDLGHVPQLEDPDSFMNVVTSWLDRRVSGASIRSSG
jgi:pimeloyl-ACP methyl ester carboxylesterase